MTECIVAVCAVLVVLLKIVLAIIRRQGGNGDE